MATRKVTLDNSSWFYDNEGGLHEYSKWVKAL